MGNDHKIKFYLIENCIFCKIETNVVQNVEISYKISKIEHLIVHKVESFYKIYTISFDFSQDRKI